MRPPDDLLVRLKETVDRGETHFVIKSDADETDVSYLFRIPCFQRIQTLLFSTYVFSETPLPGHAFPGHALEHLASSRFADNLRGLLFSNCRIPDRHVAHLLSSTRFPLLKTLAFAHTTIGAKGIASLVANPSLSSQITLLDLDTSSLDPNLTSALFRADFSSLETLCLSQTYPGQEGIKSLAQNPTLAKLSFLSLDSCGLSDKDFQILGSSSSLSRLRTLQIYDNLFSWHPRAFFPSDRFPVLETIEFDEDAYEWESADEDPNP